MKQSAIRRRFVPLLVELLTEGPIAASVLLTGCLEKVQIYNLLTIFFGEASATRDKKLTGGAILFSQRGNVQESASGSSGCAGAKRHISS
ncbi:MAG: hypothetical protein AAF724_12225 [Pseudomonadota bacterium]